MRARVVAPLVAAVLGICGGVATALVVAADKNDGASVSDPLNLGIPLKNQDCSGESLLVVGYGDTTTPLSNAVANSGKEGLRYLRSAGSCATVLGPEPKPTPQYVVYRGPYPSRSEPCELRMSGAEPDSFVTVLRDGNEQHIKCLCEIPSGEAPRLFVGMDTDVSETLWIRGLQAMFNDDAPAQFPHDAITGVYDRRTADRVTTFQDDAPGKQTVRGVVDATTWRILTGRLCRNY